MNRRLETVEVSPLNNGDLFLLIIDLYAPSFFVSRAQFTLYDPRLNTSLVLDVLLHRLLLLSFGPPTEKNVILKVFEKEELEIF